jgi:hypothetical protein
MTLAVSARPGKDYLRCLVSGHRSLGECDRVVARDDVVEGLVIAGTACDVVDGGVDEAEVAVGVLVGQGGDQRSPQRRGCAGPGGGVTAGTQSPAGEAPTPKCSSPCSPRYASLAG